MNASSLFRNGCARAEAMSGISLLRLIWTGQPTSEGYRTSLLNLLEELSKESKRYLLFDERRLLRRSGKDIKWYGTEVLPVLLSSGVKRVAIIGQRDTRIAKLPEVAYFDNMSMAMLWLLGNGKSDPHSTAEMKRLEVLRSYRVLDTEAQASYDDITRIASSITNAPIALISLVDEDRQWFKSSIGVPISETPRAVSFCSHAIENPEQVMVVKDATTDPRFERNPLVTDAPNIRFYAGAPLVGTDGHAVGTLCVIDRKPRKLEPSQLDSLSALARMVVMQLEYRRLACDLKDMHSDMETDLAKFSSSENKLEDILDRQLNYLLATYPHSELEQHLPN